MPEKTKAQDKGLQSHGGGEDAIEEKRYVTFVKDSKEHFIQEGPQQGVLP